MPVALGDPASHVLHSIATPVQRQQCNSSINTGASCMTFMAHVTEHMCCCKEFMPAVGLPVWSCIDPLQSSSSSLVAFC